VARAGAWWRARLPCPYEVIVEDTPVPPVLGDAADLREVLTNLVFNALDAMPRGGR
jgi:signal transduction histidine kinase